MYVAKILNILPLCFVFVKLKLMQSRTLKLKILPYLLWIILNSTKMPKQFLDKCSDADGNMQDPS